MVSQKLGVVSCWVLVFLLAAAAAEPLATADVINVEPQAETSSIFASISVAPPLIGTGSKVTVTVKLVGKATATMTYTVTSSSTSIKCEAVKFGKDAETATTTCEVDPGCALGSYTVTVAAPPSDKKTSPKYHVACKNVFDREYGPFKVSAPGCHNCFQDCITKLFTCKTCQCKCQAAGASIAGFPTEEACETAEWCECDNVEGVVVQDHQCELVKYDTCDNTMKCKVNEYYHGPHKHTKYSEREYEQVDDSSEEYDRGMDAYPGDSGEYHSKGYDNPQGPYGNRGPRY